MVERKKISEAARELSRLGAAARIKKQTPEQRSAAARKAVNARWRKYRALKASAKPAA
jgi:hypothetical protein